MKDKLFNTERKRLAAKAAFTTLLTHPGWLLFEQVTKANIEVVKRIILKGGIPEDELNGYRKKLEAYEEDLNCPRVILKNFDPVEGKKVDLDPYPTKEELREKRSQPKG